jgi:DNA-binding XRE family transcriptional regulator
MLVKIIIFCYLETMKSKSLQTLPGEITKMLETMGKNIRIARARRKMPRRELALRAQVSEPTLKALEDGSPTVGIGIFLKVLFILGLHKDFEKLASPERDKEGIYRETMTMPKRVHGKKRLEDMI